MGWKWGNAIQGALSGARAGAKVGGPYGAAFGAAGGAALGGLGDDFDKKFTGNSQSGPAHAGMDLINVFNGVSGAGGGDGFIKGGGFNPNDLPKGAGISMGGSYGDGVSRGGFGFEDGAQIAEMFQQFQAQRNPTDTTAEGYDPMEHAGVIKSRYPFIPDQTFQTWLMANGKNSGGMGGYQFAGR